ncbi:MAG: response regulator [Archangium sp.]|nr:response regulator [Archangium sp.]
MSAARVLVVDDNVSFVDNLLEILTDAGHAPFAAGSCAVARAEAAKGFDIALVDMRLPDGEGTGLAIELRALQPDAAVVLLTGYSTVEAAAAAVRAGAFAYLSKPCATPELLLTVEQARRQVQLQVEKRELARRALTAEKLAAVGTMTAGLSHEIRNPLNAAGLQLAVLERRIERLEAVELKAALLGPLHLVRDEIRRLDHLLEDFLQLARPRELLATSVDLSALVGRVFDLLERDAERRGVRLVRHLGEGVCALGDDNRLRQAVMNLALNALEASPGGAVTATLVREGPDVVLHLDDAGPGVPHDLRERIFEPFFTTKAQGSGLGLPIVHAIVTQHGGRLSVGDAPAGGARFTLRLPAA